jgi:hypothetical protein
MNLNILKERIKNVLPILDRNLQLAHAEYMACDISAGAYGTVLHRHALALQVIANDLFDDQEVLTLCAPLYIDIKSGVKDMPNPAAYTTVVNEWFSMYEAAGFTEKHVIFDFPVRPKNV